LEKNTKLSIETKVAAAVAAGFVALTVGAIAQGNSGGPNGYGPTNNPGVNPHMSQQGYSSSLSGRNNAEENRQKFSVQDETATTPNNGRKSKTVKSRKHHMQPVRQNEHTQASQPGD
jgi:hypothetical protein